MVKPVVIEPDESGEFTVLLKNEGLEPLYLEAREAVAEASPVDMEPPLEQELDKVQVNTLMPNSTIDSGRTERDAKLLRMLGIDATRLTLSQRDELVGLVLQYQDVFALDDEELGVTSVVQHQIDTGDATPIKQYARRIPHAVREKVQELVSEMLAKRVIQAYQKPLG